MLAYAQRVVIVPGYGLAVAQAQHAVRELADLLEARGVDVKYAIHPVAGRMPGHMNVLLAEANVPYPQLYDMDDINPEFPRTDVALVIGANDVTNPAARDDPESPLYGMPILNVDQAANVVVLKRSMSPGFAGIDNDLFYGANSAMLFGDAKVVRREARRRRQSRLEQLDPVALGDPAGRQDLGQHPALPLELGLEARADLLHQLARVADHGDLELRIADLEALADRPVHDVCAAHGEVLLHAPGRNAERLEVLGRDEEDIALAAAAMGAALDAFVLEDLGRVELLHELAALRRAPDVRDLGHVPSIRRHAADGHRTRTLGLAPAASRLEPRGRLGASCDFDGRRDARRGRADRPARSSRGATARCGSAWTPQPPTLVVILKPDHVRDVDLFVRRYGARAFGPSLFWRDDIPETELEAIEPGSELPGGLVALYDGRGRNETPLWAPERRAIVFADALTERGGELRVWGTPWHEERALPALRALLDLPFEHVVVSHGEPVHDRAAFERALELPAFGP